MSEAKTYMEYIFNSIYTTLILVQNVHFYLSWGTHSYNNAIHTQSQLLLLFKSYYCTTRRQMSRVSSANVIFQSGRIWGKSIVLSSQAVSRIERRFQVMQLKSPWLKQVRLVIPGGQTER